jgi:hypothetical protein
VFGQWEKSIEKNGKGEEKEMKRKENKCCLQYREYFLTPITKH